MVVAGLMEGWISGELGQMGMALVTVAVADKGSLEDWIVMLGLVC